LLLPVTKDGEECTQRMWTKHNKDSDWLMASMCSVVK